MVVEALLALRLEARRDFFVRRWQSLGASLPLMVSDVFERAPSFFFPKRYGNSIGRFLKVAMFAVGGRRELFVPVVSTLSAG